jgi:L-alanine-DL-glutamate epimerase-like enolase superfamily enzyme
MFRITRQRMPAERGWARPAIITACCAIDIALWDILGKAAGLPLYKVLGGYANRARAYVGGGYYRDDKGLTELREEMLRFREMGYDAFKMKIGALPLRDDLARVAAVREAIGPESALMVDVNGAWDLQRAREGVRALGDFGLTWIEEPLCWADAKRSLPLLRAGSPLAIAEGHNEETHLSCIDFIERGAVDIIQFDATSFAGITHGRKIMAMAEAHHLRFSPHLELQIHAHLVAASPAGFMVESHADPARDPMWFEVFRGAPEFKDGWVELSDRPGLGIELDEKAVAQYAGASQGA